MWGERGFSDTSLDVWAARAQRCREMISPIPESTDSQGRPCVSPAWDAPFGPRPPASVRPPVCQARTRETGRRRGRAQGGCTEGAPGPACPPETGRSSSHGHFTHWSPVRQRVQPRPFPRRGRHCPRFSWLLLLPPSSLPPPRPTRCHERERDRERDKALRLEQTELRRPTQWGAGGSWGLPVPLKSTLVLFLRGWNFPATSDSTS